VQDLVTVRVDRMFDAYTRPRHAGLRWAFIARWADALLARLWPGEHRRRDSDHTENDLRHRADIEAVHSD
jgi:hypothetical protein